MPYLTTAILSPASSGLFICDLSMHDFSRDLLLASSQQSNELKDALTAEVEKTKLMEESMVKLDHEMKRSDELLSQMMPKSVAQKIKEGASAVDTCEVFEMVTIVFNDIPMFGDICAQCDGMQIVTMLNQMFGMFDVLSDKNKVYKVETVKVIHQDQILVPLLPTHVLRIVSSACPELPRGARTTPS